MVPGVVAVLVTYIGEEWPPRRVPFIMSLYVSGTALGGFIGRLTAGLLADWFSWRVSFLALGLASLAGAAAVAAWLPHGRLRPRSDTVRVPHVSLLRHGSPEPSLSSTEETYPQTMGTGFSVKGTGFSPYKDQPETHRALAPEGSPLHQIRALFRSSPPRRHLRRRIQRPLLPSRRLYLDHLPPRRSAFFALHSRSKFALFRLSRRPARHARRRLPHHSHRSPRWHRRCHAPFHARRHLHPRAFTPGGHPRPGNGLQRGLHRPDRLPKFPPHSHATRVPRHRRRPLHELLLPRRHSGRRRPCHFLVNRQVARLRGIHPLCPVRCPRHRPLQLARSQTSPIHPGISLISSNSTRSPARPYKPAPHPAPDESNPLNVDSWHVNCSSCLAHRGVCPLATLATHDLAVLIPSFRN